MKRLVFLLAAVGLTALPGFALASTGTATLIIHEHTGAPPVNIENGSLPDVFFAVPDSGSGSYGAAAHASPLELGASGFIQTIGNNVCKCVGVGAYVNARAVTQETFDLPGPVGVPVFLVYDMTVEGNAFGTATGNGSFTLPPHGAVSISARAGINSDPVTATGLSGATYNTVPTFFASVAPQATQIRIEVPYVFGTALTVWLKLESIIEGGASDGSVQAVSDYANTLHINSLTVVDAQHQPIAMGPITGGSGTVYPVPESSGVGLTALALGYLLARRRVTR